MNAMARYLTLLLVICAPVLMAQDAPEQSEIILEEASTQEHVIPDPDIPVSTPVAPVEAPEPPPWQAREDALWDLLRDGRLDELDSAVDELEHDYPQWRAPARLELLATQARQRRAIDAVRDEPAALVAMANRYPARFSCREIGNLWDVADAHRALGERDAAAGVHRRILAECENDTHRLTTLQKSVGLMNQDDYLRSLDRESARRDVQDPTLDRMRLDGYREVATAAAEEKDWSRALEYMSRIDQLVVDQRDVDGARLNAWCLRESGRPADAAVWLEKVYAWTSDSAVRADLARAYIEAGDEERAAQLATDLATDDAEMRAYLYQRASRRAAASLAAEDCKAALQYLEDAGHFGDLDRSARSTRAWSHYECGNLDSAANDFTQLYESGPDDDSAKGLVLSDYRLQRTEHTVAIAEASGGPLVDRVPTSAELPRRGGRIDHARLHLAADASVQVMHHRSWASISSSGWSSRQGDGPSRLDAWRLPIAELELDRNLSRFEFQATRLQLDSDAMEPGDFPLNTNRVTSRGITESESGLWQPLASWTYRGDVEWQIAAGATPIEGDVSATWQGRLGAANRGQSAGWDIALLRSPVSESLLSWTGAKGYADVDGSRVIFPFTWGRVTRNGVETSGYTRARDDWTLSGSLRVASYRGKNVPDNTGGQFYGLAERHVGDSAAGSWSVGPYIYLAAFEDNLGKFTPGHGGYFSPSWLVGSGLASRFRAQSSASAWYFEARASAGYQRHKEDAADLIPDSGLEQQFLAATGLQTSDLGSYGSNNEAGFAGSLELEGLRRIGQTRWHWGGYLRGRVSPEFDNYAAMLVLRFGSAAQHHEIRRQFSEPFRLID